MKLILIIVCLLLAGSCYADEAKDGAVSVQAPHNQYPSSPDWANPDAPPKFNDRDETEPSYGDTEEPSFQPEPR
ncbi:MAG: hypothetical protein PHV48_08015 [Candidatus Omnitrophica bacterium]|nr:hypothetical protein [Candidatus Omnitrophota bacterium]